MSPSKPSDIALPFDDQAAWFAWLAENHATSSGVWLRLARKASGVSSVTPAEALDVALCHGWIDSQTKSEGEQYWLQRFTPRTARSIWSKINREKVLALIASGKARSRCVKLRPMV